MRAVPVTLPHDATAAAKFLSCVAYPGADDAAKRKRWTEAALVMPYKVNGKRPPPLLRGQKTERLDEIYNRGVKRLQHRRRTAVWILLRLVAPSSRGGLKYADACREVAALAPAGYGFDGDAHTVARFFRESEPALAMAVPVWWLTAQWERGRERSSPQLGWEDLVYRDCADVPWLDWAIAIAHEVAPIIEDIRSPRRILLPQRSGGVVPQLKSPASFPRSAGEIMSLVQPGNQLEGPKL
jgi:hypothetical protein